MTLADKARAAMDGATPGPWRANYEGQIIGPDGTDYANDEIADWVPNCNAELIALAPDLARAVLAAEELADAVDDWDDAVNADTGGADEADEMLRALAAYRKAMEMASE